MNDSEFNRLADQALARIESALEVSAGGIDYELAEGGILKIEFDDGSQIIVNRHGVAKEIWVAARSGGFHYRWDGEGWNDTRGGEPLYQALERLIASQGGGTVHLS